MGRFAENDIVLKNYRIEKSIGQGAFGEVFLATHIELNGKRAIKVLLRDDIGVGSSDYQDYKNRFRQESQLMEWFSHPNMIRVYDFQEEDNVLFLIMEYASGGSLKQKLDRYRKNGERFEIKETVKLGIDVAEGLSVMHKKDVVHRDLKPSNILFDSNELAKVADLGLAQVPGGASMRSQLSLPKAHPGTPMYMSPEQEISGVYLRPASDIYSLGLILFEMLTGRSYKNIRPGTHIKDMVAGVPDWFDNYILRMLSESPKERPWDGAETAEELRKGLLVGEQMTREIREKEQKEALERARIAEQQRLEAERIKKVEEERARQQALEKAKQEEEARARQAAEERRRLEAVENAKKAAEEKARREAAEKARKEELERARLAAEEKRRKEAEEKARLAAEDKARRDAAAKAREEEKEKARLAEQERIRKEAEEKAKKDAEEKARLQEQITQLETQGMEACAGQNWPAARQTVKELKKLGKDGQAAALRIKAEIKEESIPVWKKYWWAGAMGAVIVAGLILWQTGVYPPQRVAATLTKPVLTSAPAALITGTPLTVASITPAATDLAFTATSIPDVLIPDETTTRMIEYTVSPGDTIRALAIKFDVNQADIVSANQIKENAPLKNGQVLLIPLKIQVMGGGAALTPTAAGPATASTVSAAAPTASAPVFDKDKLLVGIVLPSENETYDKELTELFQNSFSSNGIKIEISGDNKDEKYQYLSIMSLLDKGIKVLVIDPIDNQSTSISDAVSQARKLGVKIISFDNLLYDDTLVDAAIGFDPVQIGKIQGDYLVQKAGQRKGIPLYLYAGTKTDMHAEMYFQGAWSVLQPKIADGTFVVANSTAAVEVSGMNSLSNENIKAVINQIGSDWIGEEAAKLAEANLSSANPKMKGDVFILSPYDNLSRSLADVFSSDKTITSYVITGMGSHSASLEYIKAGKQSMTIYPDDCLYVRDVVSTAISFLKGETPNLPGKVCTGKGYVPSTEPKIPIITKENYNEAFNNSNSCK